MRVRTTDLLGVSDSWIAQALPIFNWDELVTFPKGPPVCGSLCLRVSRLCGQAGAGAVLREETEPLRPFIGVCSFGGRRMPSLSLQLDQAREHVRQLERRIVHQALLIEQLRSDRHDTAAAERLMATFLDLMTKLTLIGTNWSERRKSARDRRSKPELGLSDRLTSSFQLRQRPLSRI